MSAQLFDFPVRHARRPDLAGHPDVIELRRHTRAVIRARTEEHRAELVSALLLAMEAAPLAPVLAYAQRDVAGRPFVAVYVGDTAFRMTPDDCRTAASALVEDQAFAGCMGVAADLRETAAVSELRSPGVLSPPITQATRGRTGIGATVVLATIIIAATLLSWALGQ